MWRVALPNALLHTGINTALSVSRRLHRGSARSHSAGASMVCRVELKSTRADKDTSRTACWQKLHPAEFQGNRESHSTGGEQRSGHYTTAAAPAAVINRSTLNRRSLRCVCRAAGERWRWASAGQHGRGGSGERAGAALSAAAGVGAGLQRHHAVGGQAHGPGHRRHAPAAQAQPVRERAGRQGHLGRGRRAHAVPVRAPALHLFCRSRRAEPEPLPRVHRGLSSLISPPVGPTRPSPQRLSRGRMRTRSKQGIARAGDVGCTLWPGRQATGSRLWSEAFCSDWNSTEHTWRTLGSANTGCWRRWT